MATRNLGFERERNLDESVDDRQILNNLAGGNIQLDIGLFRNNKRNTSSLIWQRNTESSGIVTNKFVFPTSVFFIYTNGDEVKVQGSSLGNLNINTTYYIVDFELNVGTLSNQLAFGLSTTQGGSRVTLGSITSNVTFIRKDEVTNENILKIATPDIKNASDGVSQSEAFSYNIGQSFIDAFDQINTNVDLFEFLSREKYATNQNVKTDKRIVIEGNNLITDPAVFNITSANLSQEFSPGVYITNPFSSILNIEKTRAYSSDSQPWVEGTGKLTTKSSQVNIGDLYFLNGISITGLDGLVSESGNVSEFTHKLPILVNGVEYFVLVKS